ncbi:AAA family ATPase [Nocardioides sp. YIM 152315]|uniref:AAA family ATPase n=1 Tax=Nocardioides sp. YIM 152315 TaxID=3031760 RepID=UPI0023DBA78C|nr:AAA family ATPase [Nocardioides sp. YIM 152315]MDF1602080.1 AAA family ATPase [Nocardioides sp. YIM 152315]
MSPSRVVFSASTPLDPPSDDGPLRWSDVRGYGRRLVRRFVAQARAAEQPTFRTMIGSHFGIAVDDLAVSAETWPAYEHVNVQAALDVWLARPATTHEVLGLADYRHRGSFGLADLLGQDDPRVFHGPRPGNVTRTSLPIGPDGATRECLRAAVLLVSDGDDRLAILFRGPDPESDLGGVAVEVVATRDGLAGAVTARLRELALELNVHRGQVVSFGHSMFGERASLLRFHPRRPMAAGDLILPEATFADIRRQVVGVARSSERLRAAGQHLKRGLLYGPPGVGKTHTVRYLVGELGETTIIELTGETLGAIREACSIARSLQPAMIVVEDVDLIAQERDRYGGETPLLFTLLNEMDGLAEDADVVFLLTTNRADLLEPALAARPGRVDQAVYVDLPSRDDRRRLVELYVGGLDVDLSRIDDVLDRTDGVTASFLKELLRRAAVIAAERQPDAELVVSADDVDASLAELLDTRNQMTRSVLGYRSE